MKDEFYRRVRDCLDERYMKQKDLAPILGIKAAYISQIMNGQVTPNARAVYIPRIAEYLGIEELPEDVEEYLNRVTG